VLRAIADSGRCEIGAHLHPWVNPPHQGPINAFNSYPGNLPESLEREKLGCLATRIEESFGQRPRIYKAGRYGLGPASFQSIASLGFEIDTSIVPAPIFASRGRFRLVLSVPMSPQGHLAPIGPFRRALACERLPIYPAICAPAGAKLKIPGRYRAWLQTPALSPEEI
jgi:hypothetical protein